jgi:hypothetical protein
MVLRNVWFSMVTSIDYLLSKAIEKVQMFLGIHV